MRISKRDIKATDPGAPFGGGTAGMPGAGGGSGTPTEANPTRTGPPPAAAGASHVIRCNECGKVLNDGGELDEHMRKEHFVSDSLASRTTDDVTIPTALIFIDALGDTLPFKPSFTFKELSDFCHREGVNVIQPAPLTEIDLLKIAEHVALLTNNHIEIIAKPTKTASRDPLSAVDLGVAERAANRVKQCRRCTARIAPHRIYCDGCQSEGPQGEKKIGMYAYVTLKDGTNLHVVDFEDQSIVGVDDFFNARGFAAHDVATLHNMDDDLRTIEAARCSMCGEETYAFASKCANCGSPNGSPQA